MRIGKRRGSYLPVLCTVVQQTKGPILELGVGFCSTPYLHWICYPDKRRVVSYENNPEYYPFAKSWEDTFHEIHCLDDFSKADLSEDWEVAFVDHSPGERRAIESSRLVHADYVVCHDSEGRNDRRYHLSTIEKLFKYQWIYADAYPHTTVFSNKFDPSVLFTGILTGRSIIHEVANYV